tara:strand:- start:9090 stop:9254 length:165 start_codon:yes stop_codon:yes gene_type:complete
MIKQGDCRFIGSIVSLEDGAARVQKVKEGKIIVQRLDGTTKECYYDNIQYVWTP